MAHPKRIPNCPKCRIKGIRNERFDAYYCDYCDIWLEPGCGETDCKFCMDRPERPKEKNMHFLTGAPLEYTVAIIKPDAVRAGYMGNIITMMEVNFFVADIYCTTWPRAFAERFYEEHQGKPYYNALATFMSSGRLAMITLVSPDAVGKWRAMMGATDPAKASELSVRGRYGAHDGVVMHNAVHGSDSIESAAKEGNLIRTYLTMRSTLTQNMLREPSQVPQFGEEAFNLIEKYKNLVWKLDEHGKPTLTPR